MISTSTTAGCVQNRVISTSMTAGSPSCIQDMERGRAEAGFGGVVARPMGSCAHKHIYNVDHAASSPAQENE